MLVLAYVVFTGEVLSDIAQLSKISQMSSVMRSGSAAKHV